MYLRGTVANCGAADKPSPGRLDRPPGSGTGGVRASTRRMAGCAIPTSSAGHAPAGAKADPKLTFDPDHLVGAVQERASNRRTAGTGIRFHLSARRAV